MSSMSGITQNKQATVGLERAEELLPRWRELAIYQALPWGVDYSHLPLITKRELRENFPHNFLREGQDLEALLAAKAVELEHTSGSSEDRTPVLFPRGWWNEQEARILRLNRAVAHVLDEFPNARRATLVPPVCNGLVCFSNYTAKAARTLDASLFVNQARIPFLVTEADFARMAKEITEWAPQFLDLDPVHGAWFALYCERKGIRFPTVKFLLCSYEFVSVVHRKILQRVFGVPVFNFYGSTETGHLLMENERGEMKASPANVYYEIVSPDERGIGDMVVTTLTNQLMPLVRYRVGDLVQKVNSAGGNDYRLHGRTRDALRRADGRRVTTLDVDDCFTEVAGMAHYQLRQAANGDCDLQFIPDRELPSATALKLLAGRLADLMQLKNNPLVVAVEKLPPLPSGKFRLTFQV